MVIPLKNKGNFLANFGDRAAARLTDSSSDVVVGLPDLHPVQPNPQLRWKHVNAGELKSLQETLVRNALVATQGLNSGAADAIVKDRMFASVFKHDFEMLLLAAREQLRSFLRTKDSLANAWREPVESQNLDRPPKRVVEELFLTKSRDRRAYRDTTDAPAILRRVDDCASILKTSSGQLTCPEFVAALNWLGQRLGEPCCATSL